MIASMYHSGSPGRAVGGWAAACVARARVSMELAPDDEDVGGLSVGVEHHEVGRAAPREGIAPEAVLDAEVHVARQAELREVQVHPAALDVVRVEVHHDQDA